MFQGKRKSSDVVIVRTIEMKKKILAVCSERGDSWASAVKAQILQVHDIHAADAVYHRTCSAPKQRYVSKKFKLGCPQDQERTDAFLEAASYLEENDDEQITITDLIERMENNLAESEHHTYSFKHMKFKTSRNIMIISEINGKSDCCDIYENN